MANANDGLDAVTQLPMNQTTNVRVEAKGRSLTLYLNGTEDKSITLSADRYSGPATLQVGSKRTLAVARIGPIQMTPE